MPSKRVSDKELARWECLCGAAGHDGEDIQLRIARDLRECREVLRAVVTDPNADKLRPGLVSRAREVLGDE